MHTLGERYEHVARIFFPTTLIHTSEKLCVRQVLQYVTRTLSSYDILWRHLKACHVKSQKQLWTKFGTWLPLTLCGPISMLENCVWSIFYFIKWTVKGVVRLWSEILKSKTREHEWKWSRWNRSRIIFGRNSVYRSLGPLVVHLWKGTTTFGLILA